MDPSTSDRDEFEQAIVRGSELLKQNQLTEAQRAFQTALDLEPDSARVLALLGLAHFRAGEFAEARPIYEDLVERAPSDASHRLNLGLVYLKLNDAEHAITSLEASRALDPSQGRAVSYLGLAYARAGRYAEAYRSFLLANQNELATEIEQNLTPSERDGIHAQLQRSPSGRTPTPQRGLGDIRPPSNPIPIARTITPVGNRTVSGELGGRTPTPSSLPVTLTPPATPRITTPPPSDGDRADADATNGAAPPARPTPPPFIRPTSQELLAQAWTTDDRPNSQELPAVARAITPAPRSPTPPRGSRASGEIPIIPADVVLIDAPPPRDQTGEIPLVERATPAATTPPVPPATVEIQPRSRPPTQPPANRVQAIELVADEPPVASAMSAVTAASAISQPSSSGEIPRMTESMQFVLGLAKARAERSRSQEMAAIPDAPLAPSSMISLAVAAAEPSTIAVTPQRTRSGASLPRPLSELATDELIQIDDDDHPFEISPSGALVIRIKESMFTRLDGVHVVGGDLAFKLAMRHSRGRQLDETFDYGADPLRQVTGTGYLIAAPTGRTLTTVVLDDDIFYLREDLVFAFEPTLRWENGNVPGLRGRLPVVQFRGDGAVAMSLARPLVRVKLPPQGLLLVDAPRLAGWIGRVIPRAVVPPVGGPLGDVCIECTGEGIVLVEPAEPAPSRPRIETARVPLAGTPRESYVETTRVPLATPLPPAAIGEATLDLSDLDSASPSSSPETNAEAGSGTGSGSGESTDQESFDDL